MSRYAAWSAMASLAAAVAVAALMPAPTQAAFVSTVTVTVTVHGGALLPAASSESPNATAEPTVTPVAPSATASPTGVANTPAALPNGSTRGPDGPGLTTSGEAPTISRGESQ